MKFSVQLPIQWQDDPQAVHSGTTIASLAGAIEKAGFDACFVTEHPAPPAQWLHGGGHATLDPFVALSYAGAGSCALRLHTNILVLSYRNPLLTAKAVASLDALSGGRVICGAGVGYLESEFTALGASFSSRGRVTDEALEVMKAAWTGAPVTWQGSNFDAREVVVQPRPLQRPHPPLWIGGNSERAMRRAARYGDAWTPFPTSRAGVTAALPDMATLEQRIVTLRKLCAEEQREADLDICMVPFGWSMTDRVELASSDLLEQLRQLAELGVTWTVLALEARSERHYLERLQSVAEEVLTPLRQAAT